MNEEKIKAFVLTQLKAGLEPAEITTHLLSAGWSEYSIDAAFASAQREIKPPAPTFVPSADQAQSSAAIDIARLLSNDAANATTVDEQSNTRIGAPPPSSDRGKFKTGLKSFMQRIRIRRGTTD